ncbi:MAG: hypothetical protein ACRC2O_00085 [Chitinophagaceae bacterium]
MSHIINHISKEFNPDITYPLYLIRSGLFRKISNYPSPDNHFDAIFSIEVFAHIKTILKIIQENGHRP